MSVKFLTLSNVFILLGLLFSCNLSFVTCPGLSLLLLHSPDSLISSSPTVKDHLLFLETFEEKAPLARAHSTDFGTEHAFSVVSKPTYSGSKSGRFELRDTDPLVNNGKRAETTIIKHFTGNDMWYSFAVYLPAKDFAKDSQQEVISQWHQSPDKHLGEKPQSPATALRIKRDRFYLDTGFNEAPVSDGVHPESRKKIDIGPATKDTWHEFVIHIVHSYKQDGLVELWHNGNKIIIHSGGNMYNSVLMPKWKIGIYKASFKRGDSEVNKRVVYFDNIKVGNGNATYADMKPGTKGASVE